LSDFTILTAIKGHLLIERAARPVHLALPSKASYPYVLITIEDIRPRESLNAKYIQRHIRFKVSVYYLNPNIIEAENFSYKIIRSLHGVNLWFPKIRSASIRLLSCIAETAIDEKQANAIHHLYDAAIIANN
jgi:hypothetical protein